ncbi:acyltransferase [Vibrio jasicida]|uniref:acyltransferase n=1 Tax=Vibrio jasicida TaxID=766224 RepID=UPI00406843AB
MSYLTVNEIKNLGFSSVGENVRISDKASIYNPGSISIGSNVRIDDFCILSAGNGGINIGNFVHLAAYSCLIGAENITLSDFSGLSSRVSIFSSSDDYLGYGMTNPTVPEQFTKVKSLPVYLGKHAIVGAHSVLLPGSTLQEGTAVGANSLVS